MLLAIRNALRSGIEEKAVTNWSKHDLPLMRITFDRNWLIFYHSRLTDEPTGTIKIFVVLVFNVANSVETNVFHKTTPISRTIIH